MKTFYWYDYETFGINARTDRIAQFAGIRTDENLNVLDEHMFYCKPTYDSLPSPEACAVTEISPQFCEKHGDIEHQFINKINQQFSQANTCVVGYNSIRFDDEFTRHALFRNFLDPYAWHWQNNNTRWDIIDVVRLCYAFKKNETLNWVYNDEGNPVFKLDQLAPANGIEHTDAHDALADVRATIGIAKIIKNKQPKLFDYAFSLRQKSEVEKKIQLFEPVLHTSSKYPAKLSCTRLVAPLAYHPKYPDRAILFNLDQDPSTLLALTTDELKTLLFTKKSELPEGVERLQIKEMVFNKSPMITPYRSGFPSEHVIKQLKIDIDQCMKHLAFIKENQIQISQVVQKLYGDDTQLEASGDVDQSLYEGFIDNADRRICNQIQNLSENELSNFHPKFNDKRLGKLLMHFKARNYPNSLSDDEKEDWFEIVQSRVQAGDNGYLSIEDYYQKLSEMRQQHPEKSKLWNELESFAERFL